MKYICKFGEWPEFKESNDNKKCVKELHGQGLYSIQLSEGKGYEDLSLIDTEPFSSEELKKDRNELADKLSVLKDCDCRIVYIGSAALGNNEDGIYRRLNQFYRTIKNGKGNHKGGCSVAYLKNWEELEIWAETYKGNVRPEESSRIRAFKAKYGVYPFANRRG